MKVYVITTGVVFGLLFAAHIWRVIVEGIALRNDPFFVAFTVAAAGFCIWAAVLAKKSR